MIAANATAKTQTRIDRYFEAFEAGTPKPALCNEKVQSLNARLEELKAERQALEGRQMCRSTNRRSSFAEPEVWFASSTSPWTATAPLADG